MPSVKLLPWPTLLILSAAIAEPYPVTAPPASLELDAFYEKYAHAQGYPVIASGGVNDYALKEAAYLVDMMLARRPDIRKAMIESGSRLIIIGHDQFTTDIPEFSHYKPKDYWDRRARGTGGSATDPLCTCAEENVLGYPGDPYAAECILIHEFAHNIHLRGLSRIDRTFDRRLKDAYKAAMARGLWKGKYAATNHHEYFAEGVQSWFNNNRPPDHDHNHVDTRRELVAYDAGLANLCREVFGETKLKYTKPHTRLVNHLAGYDPSKAPTFEWPERLVAIGKQIRAKAERRGKPLLLQHEKRSIEGWTVRVDRRLLDGKTAKPGSGVLGQEALKLLAIDLHRIARTLPAKQLAQLREIEIYLDLEHDLMGMQYHPGAQWLKERSYETGMERAVHLTSAREVVETIRDEPGTWWILGILAHGFHHRVLGYDHAEIRKAYERAKASGKLQRTLFVSGRRAIHPGLEDHRTYFAEMTRAYVGANHCYPFVRAELKDFDPELHKLLKSIWGG